MSDIVERLRKAFDEIAVCHCGDYCKDHGYNTGHSAVWMKCPDTELLYDAKTEIERLRTELARVKLDAKNDAEVIGALGERVTFIGDCPRCGPITKPCGCDAARTAAGEGNPHA